MTHVARTRSTDTDLVAALRRGDETAFAELVDAHHASFVRLAQTYVRDGAAAEDVVQETWLAVIRGIDRFEGRSALRTWLFSILTNLAKTRATRDARTVPYPSFDGFNEDDDEPAVDPSRFRGAGDRWPGGWVSFPERWDTFPEQRLLSDETRGLVAAAISTLPTAQRQVITLRDVEGFDADEVCTLLELTPGNQRVLLHRARSKVRAALERHLTGDLAEQTAMLGATP